MDFVQMNNESVESMPVTDHISCTTHPTTKYEV